MKTLRSVLTLAAAAAALALSGCGRLDTGIPGRPDETVTTMVLHETSFSHPPEIWAMAVQPDGKTLIAGQFTHIGDDSRPGIARLNEDGSLDFTFLVQPTRVGEPTHRRRVRSIAVQADGKILIAGNFTGIGFANEDARPGLARLFPNGALDTSFAPVLPASGISPSVITGMAVQPDGRILLCGTLGAFAVGGTGLMRFFPDGTRDFSMGITPGVQCMALQPDGKIVTVDYDERQPAGGSDVVGYTRIERRLADGSRDDTFQAAQLELREGAVFGAIRWDGIPHAGVNAIMVQPDGKILFGGDFTKVNDETRRGLARLLADGTLEGTGSFDIGSGAAGSSVASLSGVKSIALQADGKILVGGDFTSFNGQPRTTRMVRLFANGNVDAIFDTAAGVDKQIITLAQQGDGEVLLGGIFDSINGAPHHRFGRLNSTPATQNLEALDGNRVRWMRGGSAPEVEQVKFEVSTDGGANWNPLGAGTRIAGGWQLAGLSLPAGGLLRATGSTTTSGRPVATTDDDFRYGQSILDQGVTPAYISSGRVGQVTEFPCEGDGALLDTAITAGPAGNTSATGASFGFAATRSAPTFTYRLDGGAPVTVAALTASFTGLAPGVHTFSVFATLQSGYADPTPAVRTWTVAPITPRAGSPDTGFIHAEDTPPFVSGGAVQRLAVQPDGKILAAGAFSTVEGEPRRYLARFLPDGALEETSTFDIGEGLLDYAIALAVQPDGKILLAGYFPQVNGLMRPRIARLLPNGAVESTETFDTGAGANSNIEAMVLQPDGKIVIAGDFTSFNGQPRARIARLNPDGSLDGGYIPNVSGSVYTMALQPDGKVLIAGAFSQVDGQPRPGLARLLTTGGLDPGFVPAIYPGSYPFAIAVQRDGHILVSGFLQPAVPGPTLGLVRLLPDGSAESAATFLPGTDVSNINDMTLQADGRIVVGGSFETMRGQPRGGIAVLLPDGSLAPTSEFDAGAGARHNAGPGTVHAIALQADGKILLGGQFNNMSGRAFTGIARLVNHGAVSEITLDAAGTAQWLVGNTAPDVDQVRFGMDTGTGWQDLGPGVRTLAGWKICGLLQPAAGTSLGAIGRASSKTGNGSLVAKTRLFGSARQRWREDTFGADAANPAIAGDLADPDGDGVANLMEYAGGSHALNAGSRPRMAGGVEGSNAFFIAERPIAATGITYGVEQSTDLQTWTDAAFTEEVLTDNGITRTVKVTVPMEMNNPAKPEGFIRGKVSVIPPP